MICPFASVPSARTLLLYFVWYGSLLKYGVRFDSWPLSPSVRASVNGTSNTVGSVPAASFAAKVGAVHWYSTGLILMLGFAFSNCETWVLNCWTAAAELPGINDATLIVTAFAPDVAPAAVAATIIKHPAATATQMVLRADFIALLLSVDLLQWLRLRLGGARPWRPGGPRPLRGCCSRSGRRVPVGAG